ASAFQYTASRLITFQSLDSNTVKGNYGFVNAGEINAKGVELEAEARSKRGVQGVMSYVRESTDQPGTDVPLSNAPQQMFKVRFTVPLMRQAFASAEWPSLSARSKLAGHKVRPASVVRMTGGWPS